MPESGPLHATTARTRASRRTLEARGPGDFAIVGIGASSGGLDACAKLLDALPVGSAMAFILVQHLGPTHESMMVNLLANHTAMIVRQATDGMPIEPEHLYLIPPGADLAVEGGALRLSRPQARHGARLPFDILLHSLAKECGERAICVILSGGGADGSLGAKAVKEAGGLVIAQDPDEAAYDGMPRSAILAGVVDLVLPVARIPHALLRYERRMILTDAAAADGARDWLPEVVELLRSRTGHDFRLYKPGTLRRRIERRRAMAAIETDDMGRYLDVLRRNAGELDLLVKDLLINVTNFFRDPKVFDHLAETAIPDLIRGLPPDRPLRLWVAGCSSGEETYSLAMLCHEAIAAAGCAVTLQMFASDVDADAVAIARAGLYPETIAAEVSPQRLARFFSTEDHGYRVLPALRETVVFTVQDVLADPPFSSIDLVSCRNLLIYLQPEAQATAISMFDFALRPGGLLLLGSSETVGGGDNNFELISKAERLYRHIGRGRPGQFGLALGAGDGACLAARPARGTAQSRQAALAEVCRRMVMETYAPAAVLINRKHECLYSLGPTDRYLRMAPGHPTHDVLAMVRQGLRAGLRSAIQQASQRNAGIVVAGGRTSADADAVSFDIDVRPVAFEGEDRLLICFVDKPKRAPRPVTVPDDPGVAALEQELEATRTELRDALRNLELSSEDRNAVNEEALSVQEEYRSTNEELLTSKEELQSLNEELTTLNSQLQETLERSRTTSNDLQNVLYSTDVATIFLDGKLTIRLFTPATKALFNIISGDIGRPLADLSGLAADGALLADAGAVLATRAPVEREIQTAGGAWFIRRILPYRAQDDAVEGVVITFTDTTARRHVADALVAATQRAELASLAKSRFLAAASHDLRQPLQTLALLQGLLAKIVEGDKAKKLVAGIDDILGAMTGMLNALLDINQIEAGTVRADMVDVPVNDLLGLLGQEFAYLAQSQGLALRMVPCGLSVHSDAHLLEQMIRNLLSNALKYTRRGKVLVGCRRRGGHLSIEIWDTGIGIPEGELGAIFEEYHQLDNAARERDHGLGLGLAIVQRLGKLLGHPVGVRSWPGKGSVFTIEVKLPAGDAAAPPDRQPPGMESGTFDSLGHVGEILVVDDEPEVRELLALLLRDEGYRVTTAVDGLAALALVAQGTVRPDLILADYNLPNGMDGLQLAAKVRAALHRHMPVIILSGDIATGSLTEIGNADCMQLSKPVKPHELTEVIQTLLPRPPAAPAHAAAAGPPVVFVVDDDGQLRDALRQVLEDDGRIVEDYATCEDFLDAYRAGREGCLLIDAYLPGMSGLELLERLQGAGHRLPAIMITGDSDVPMAVKAMKAGASDFIEKPISREDLLAGVERAMERSRDATKLSAWRESAANHVAGLTARQRQIMDMVLAGHPSKNIAADLGISQRTVENHRASIMKKTGSKSLPALARLAVAAG